MELSELNSILIIDDADFDRQLLAKKVSAWNYRVHSADNGMAGLKILESHSPDLVITDLQMPIMDGLEFIKAARRLDFRYTYIIVLSSSNDKKSIVQALAAGADDYLTKPFHPEELKTRIQAAQRILRLQSQDLLILSMAKLADFRSKETGFHLERVQYFTKILAVEYMEHHGEINPQYISLLQTLSSLHDIGKVAIPDAVLNKPGQLTNEEFSIMKNHTRIGGQLLDDIYQNTGAEQLRVARDIVLYHHERYDGAGYPQGLSGENIPLSARIVGLADVYDALTSQRCYKAALSHEKACDIILSEKGKHFDPLLVDCFERRQEDFQAVADQYKECLLE